MNEEAPATRRYRGTPPDQRRAQRRERLVAAAVRVYGERGYRQATVKAVCEAAGLTERYFYESFANSEALLAASYEAVNKAVSAALAQTAIQTPGGRAARMRAMLRTYFWMLQNDPNSARLFLLETRGVGPLVDAAFNASLRAFGQGLSQALAPDAPATPERDLLQAGVVGGVMHIALQWIADGYQPTLDQVADAALHLCMTLAVQPERRTD